MTLDDRYSEIIEKDTLKENQCPECYEYSVICDQKRGERKCQSCGIVVEEKINEIISDNSMGERKEQYKKLLKNYTLGRGTKDFKGKEMSLKKKYENKRHKKLQLKAIRKNSQDISLEKGIYEIDRISSNLGITIGIREQAILIFIKVVENKFLIGRSIEICVPTCIYIASRICRKPRSRKRIAFYSNISKRELGKCYRTMILVLGLKVFKIDAEDYLSLLISGLGMKMKNYYKAKEIIRKAKEKELLAGKNPRGIVAGAVYLSGILNNEKRTQFEIAQLIDVSLDTIRNRYKEFKKF